MSSAPCPRCTFPLTPYTHGHVELDHCQRCGGTFLEPTAAAATGHHADTWRGSFVSQGPSPSDLHCPRCAAPFEAWRLTFAGEDLLLDECPACAGLWLDAGEGPRLHALLADARQHAHEQREVARPGVLTYLFQALSGFPLEVWNPTRARPVLVYGLAVTLVALFALELAAPGWFAANAAQLMMVPALVTRGDNLWTLVTAGFFHAGWAHLLGNLYFLLVFGDNVEDVLGRGRFTILYVGALVAGNVAHILATSDPGTPLLGASGAISGLMGTYLVLFPRTKLWVVWLFIRFKLSVAWYLGLWLAFQVLMGFAGGGDVAWWAHIGGFALGVVVGYGVRANVRHRILAEHAV